ncbi:MAG: glycerol-3-phosphate 1-O-acyltransferase PlsY [Clostridiales bacterium]|nr:glycerol-3-phosphate 1-O-acyltransferase PlsY [Clostridiales bacterium]
MTMTLNQIRTNGLLPSLLAGESNEISIWLLVIFCVIGGVIAYLLGSLNFAVIISKYKFKEDIRNYGSGNGGMTNMLRTYGKAAAGFTLLGDAAKAAVSVLIGTLLAGEAGAYLAGICCVIGHSFPIYYNFKGGKGIVVTAAALLCLDPLCFLILFVIFALIVGFTKFLSLGSIIGMLLYPLLLNRMWPFTHGGASEGAIPAIASILNAVLVIWLHRENIKRLMEGKENKFSLKKKDKFLKDEKKAEDKNSEDKE